MKTITKNITIVFFSIIIQISIMLTFLQTCRKTHEFYKLTYNSQINAFQSLSIFYKSYQQVERNYINSLRSLIESKQLYKIASQIPAVCPTVNQIGNYLVNTYNFHDEFIWNLSRISTIYQNKMKEEQKNRDNFMKLVNNKSKQQIKDPKIKQKTILKYLYDNLQTLSQRAYEKIDEINQQTIQHFTTCIKIYQKQPKRISQYSKKVQCQPIRINDCRVVAIAQLLLNKFNSYNGQRIEKSFCKENNDDLKISCITKSKYKAFEKRYGQNQIKKFLYKYNTCGNQQYYDPLDNYTGVLDPVLFDKQKIRKYTRQLNGQILKRIAYQMFEGYTKAKNTSQDQNELLVFIKQNLKINASYNTYHGINFESLQKYWSVTKNQVTQQEYIYHLFLLQELSKKNTNQINLNEIITKKYKKQLKGQNLVMDSNLSFYVSVYLIDILLSSLCMSKSDEPVLIHTYIDYLQIIAKFGEQFLQVHKLVTVLLLLRRLYRLIKNNSSKEQIQTILDSTFFNDDKNKLKGLIYEQRVKKWSQILLQKITKRLKNFCQQNIPLTNYLKMLLVIEKLNSNINGRQVFNNCINHSGFNYIKNKIEEQFKDINLYNNEKLSPFDRLQSMTKGFQKLDYKTIINKFIKSQSAQISKLAGVSEKILIPKLICYFISPAYELINANLSALKQVDSEGYILKLGFQIAELQTISPIQNSDIFFKALHSYLNEIQNKCSQIRQKCRLTQIWETNNMNATETTTCLDYFQTMEKSLEFLLINLKQFDNSKSQFQIKYRDESKKRLNMILKNQIINYVQFLQQSLYPFRSQLEQFCFAAKKIEKSPPIINEQTERQKKETLKKLIQRLRNLLFIKQSLNQSISDFLDQKTNQKIDSSIYNLEQLNELIKQTADNEILMNIRQMAQALLQCEENIVVKVANITVFTCMRDLFELLYTPEEKNFLEKIDFFKPQQAEKLYENTTFKKLQNMFSQWFVSIYKNIPNEYKKQYEKHFFSAFYLALERQLLSGQKLKLEVQNKNLTKSIREDVQIAINTMRNVLNNQQDQISIGKPLSILFNYLHQQTNALTQIYFDISEKKKVVQINCQTILMILNLRVNDKEAKLFVDKNKGVRQF